jgi:putative peptidoglycan lipid II flippase
MWGNVSAEAELLIRLTAIMLPYLILICLSSQMSAMLHALGHFTWPALVPVFLNLVWIAGIWWLAPQFDTPEQQVTAVSACIVIAGFFQLLAPWPTLRRLGFRYDPHWREAKTRVKEIIAAMVPVLLGLSITQLNTVADSLIAWGFSAPEFATSSELATYPLPSGTAAAL